MQFTPVRFGLAVALSLALLGFSLPDAMARGGGSARGAHSRASSSYSTGGSHRNGTSDSRSSIRCESCARDSHGRIKRDRAAVEKFKRAHPKPPGCEHCEVDHIIPLAKGGRDDPSNMQWLSRAEHREKTRQDLAR